MPRIAANVLVVKSHLKGKPAVYQIAGVPGLHLNVHGEGRGSWRLRYRPRRGSNQTWFTLGDAQIIELSEAIAKARELMSKVQLEGKDPHDGKRAAIGEGKTVGDLIDPYLRERSADLKSRSHVEITRHLKAHWKSLHHLKVKAVTRQNVVENLDKIVGTRGKGAADRARSALSMFFAWTIDRNYGDENPTLKIKARSAKPIKNRVLNDDELRQVWRACLDDEFGKIVKLLILTLQRRSEIGDLGWSEIDSAERQILIPERRTKNSRPHIVPLSAAARAIIESVPKREKRDLLFGRRGGGYGGWTNSKAELDTRIAAACKRAGLDRSMPHWTLHDLRRTGSTQLHERGIAQPHVVEAILNHISGHQAGVAGVYNKALYLAERRTALEAWGERITQLVNL